MSEMLVRDGDVVIRELGALRRITLNRPQALNAITLGMAETMTAFMQQWADDPAAGTVLIDGAGGRAFAAGGDIRALYDAAKSGGDLPEKFWATEYRLNVLIARYPKPVVTLADGLVMGGGVGLSAHAANCIVTERSVIAMPEVGIGFFPDVGVSFLLTRAHWELGTYVALTGERLGAQGALMCGLANCPIPAAHLDEIPAALADCRSGPEIRAALGKFEASPMPGKIPKALRWIMPCFSGNTIEEILETLSMAGNEDAIAARDTMLKASPTSLKITLRNLRDAAKFRRVEECFRQDYRIALACVAGHDFIEGIRATIVDKDRKPQWRPDTIEAVTPDIVERHFKSVGKLELKFDD